MKAEMQKHIMIMSTNLHIGTYGRIFGFLMQTVKKTWLDISLSAGMQMTFYRYLISEGKEMDQRTSEKCQATKVNSLSFRYMVS